MEPDIFSSQQTQERPSLKSQFVEFFQTLVVFAAIGSVIYWQIAQPHKVSGSSMYPNFKNGDYIITDKVSYKVGEPKRGDVIVFKAPRDETQDFIKRILGVPGDTVRLEDGHFYVNEKLVEEPYLAPTIVTNYGSFLSNGTTVTVPEGEYFVSGDNRPYSSDSREWGFVKKNEIIGKVLLRYWPKEVIGIYPAAHDLSNL